MQGGRIMRKLVAALPSLFIITAIAPDAGAQHDAPVWYIDYDVTISCSHTAGTESSGGATTKIREAGSSAWEEKRRSDDATIDWLPALELELPPRGETQGYGGSNSPRTPTKDAALAATTSGVGVLRNSPAYPWVSPRSRAACGCSFCRIEVKATFTDGPSTVPVTVTYRYTVSSTPPEKAAAKR
jgi:hypothetical protein